MVSAKILAIKGLDNSLTGLEEDTPSIQSRFRQVSERCAELVGQFHIYSAIYGCRATSAAHRDKLFLDAQFWVIALDADCCEVTSQSADVDDSD